MNKIKVLVIDDSALVRAILKEIIDQSDDMEVVGTANDAYIARDKIKALNPDVLTLDIEMPKMDGLAFLEKLMQLRPMPVLMISTLTSRSSDATLKALALGAVDYINKPTLDVKNQLETYAEEIRAKIRVVAQANIKPPAPYLAKAYSLFKRTNHTTNDKQTMLLIGASTGGTEAIKMLLMQLPADFPPVLIVQHMPEGFTSSYAARLDSVCAINVQEAKHNDAILPGHAYLAPGGKHLSISRFAGAYQCHVSDEAPVNYHKPSVDVLFHSAAKQPKLNLVSVILTGMGKDGAAGLSALHQLGHKTFAQNKESCVVFGMPKEAIERGAVDEVLPLNEMASSILNYLGYRQN